MTKNRKNFLLAFTALALLSGCDDNGSSSSGSWLDWLKSKGKPGQSTVMTAPGADYARQTQAGNYLAGQFAQYRQDWKTANKYLDRVIALDPDNIDLQQRAMILAMQAGDATRATAMARKVLEEDPKNILALLFIGVDQIATQDYDGAVRTLGKMPQNGIADFIRPILIAWAKTPQKSVDNETLITDGPLHAYHALLIADYLGKVNDPERYFLNVLNGGGADTHILEMMADVYSRQGKTDLAKKIYNTLISQLKDVSPESERIKVLENKRDNPQAAQADRIQSPAQGAGEAFYNMARILYQDQSDESALVFARVSERLDPTRDDTKLLMARMMVRGDHIDDAIAFYKAVRPTTPEYLESQRSAAELLEKAGRVDESIALLEEDYSKNKDIIALVQIGDVYRRSEKFEDAIKAYDRAVDALGGTVNQEYWSVLYARGMSYERAGNFKKAEEDLEKALSFKPDHPYLLNYLGYSWADQGKKLDKALAMVQRAAKLRPDDGYIVDSLGWVYFKMGQYKDAVSQLEKAVELVPYDPTINDHLGDAYWRVGRKNEARFQWQRAINHSKDEKFNKGVELKISEGMVEKEAPLKEAKTIKPEEPVKH